MAVNRVEYGDSVLMDISGDTVSGDTLLKGATAHDASGELIEGEVDLDNYYTKEETDSKIPDHSVFATQQFVIQQVSGIDMSPYAKKTDIPSHEGLATEDYVDKQIELKKPDLSGYATKNEIPSIEGLASTGYVDQKVASVPQPDLTPYALKTEIPSTSGLASTGYVDGEIDKVMNVANGKTKTYVYDTVAALQADLSNSDFVNKLNKGDVFLIKALNVPDYWWNGAGISILETTKCDLSGYAKTADVPTIKVNSAVSADNSLTVGGYTIVISNTVPTHGNNKIITFVI